MRNIGLDIGGTSIKGAVIDGDQIVKMTQVPTQAALGVQGILQAIYSCIDMLLPYIDSEGKIGIGCAGDIDPYEGRVIYATGNLPNFTGLELKKIIEEKFNRATTVINDAVAGLIGELIYGAGRDCQNVVMITLGTGLGGGILANGKLVLGNNCRAGRLGHVTLYPNGLDCNCGCMGCAEQYVSATGLMNTAKEIGLDAANCGEIMKKSKDNNSKAVAVVDKFLTDLSMIINNYLNIFDSEIFIIGGGLVELKEYWWHKLMGKLDEINRTKVVPAQLGNQAGFYGSQYLTYNKKFL